MRGIFAGIFIGILLVFTVACVGRIDADATPDGIIVVNVPPEMVLREGAFMVAKQVVADVTVSVNGKTYVGKLTFPDTKVRRTGVGTMRVDACKATGFVR